MKYAAAILLGLLAVSAAQARGLNPWEQKARDLEIKFEKVVDHKAGVLIERIKTVVHTAHRDLKTFVDELEKDINTTITAAMKEIEVLQHDVSLECYKNATRDLYAAQQAAVENLMGCQNLSAAYRDVQEIARNASVVALDVAKDAKLIIEGLAECEPQIGLAKWKCVFKYVAEEIHQLISQWPDAKQFIIVVRELGNDAQLQINTCLNDPTQQTLDDKVQQAMAEFSVCSQKSASHFDSYVF